jgi:hypothetical protein
MTESTQNTIDTATDKKPSGICMATDAKYMENLLECRFLIAKICNNAIIRFLSTFAPCFWPGVQAWISYYRPMKNRTPHGRVLIKFLHFVCISPIHGL